jgi:two-component system, NarL family, sensor histidine kinase DegS
VNVMRSASPSDDLQEIAEAARRELASAEARIGALHERSREVAAAAAKDFSELQRFLEEFGLEAEVQYASQKVGPGTGPLFDLKAVQAGATELRTDLGRSAAFESNLGLVLHTLQSLSQQLAPEQAFRAVQDSSDLRLQQAMTAAREDERRRLAREIHDGPAQVLSNAIFAVQTAEQIAKRAPDQISEELSQLRELLKDGVAEIRRFMFDLRPTMLQDLGLVPTLVRYVDDFSRFCAKRVTLVCEPALPALTPDQELTVFRLVQEALQNVHKHGGPSAEATVTLAVTAGMIELNITDTGHGFDLASAAARTVHGAGIPGMRERANLVGGEFTLTSAPGAGTTVRLRMPQRGQTGQLRP